MFYLILTVHLLLCLLLVGLVLLQQGKGADMGAAFGGSSNTLFGASGASNVLTKVTTSAAIAFMVTSILLVRAYQHVPRVMVSPVEGSVMGTTPEQSAPPAGAAGEQKTESAPAAAAGAAQQKNEPAPAGAASSGDAAAPAKSEQPPAPAVDAKPAQPPAVAPAPAQAPAGNAAP